MNIPKEAIAPFGYTGIPSLSRNRFDVVISRIEGYIAGLNYANKISPGGIYNTNALCDTFESMAEEQGADYAHSFYLWDGRFKLIFGFRDSTLIEKEFIVD